MPLRAPRPLVAALALSWALGACEDQPDPPPFAASEASPIQPGLRPTARVHQVGSAIQGPHLSEIVVFGEHAYVANATDSVSVYHVAPDGALARVHEAGDVDAPKPCQFLAVHPPTATLFCTHLINGELRRLDLSDPARPTFREVPVEGPPAPGYWRDLDVGGDVLYAAASGSGLLHARIGPAGATEWIWPALLEGHIVQVVVDGDRLAALDTERGLRVVDVGAQPAVEVAEHALDGPLIDLILDGDRAAVAHGSRGVTVLRLADGGLAIEAQLQPECVATAVALQGDLLAVACASGLHAYDLAAAGGPRRLGFEPSLGVMLDVAFVGSEPASILVSDWEFMSRFEVDRAGDVVRPDRARGVYVRPGEDAVLAVRNPGRAPLHVWLEAPEAGRGTTRVLGHAVMAPGETVGFELSRAKLGRFADNGGDVHVEIRSLEAPAREPVAMFHLATATVAVRDASVDPTLGHPAIGDPFPWVRLTAVDGVPVERPRAGERQRFVFYGEDCSGMWAEVLDLDWLAAAGAPPEGLTPLLVTHAAPSGQAEFVYNLRLGGAVYLSSHGPHSAMQTLAAPEGEFIGDDVYNLRFWFGRIPGGANHPTDYLVAADGTVERVDRVYRGAWPLVPDRIVAD